jgi:pyruvate dehydrogenase E2 component (dihydrolipoamide acetyltransferase)
MATEVTMPRLSDSMEEGTILRWIVSEGDEVKRGEPLVEIETDKANMTYESDTDGTLIEIVAGEGDTLPIGEVIARIGEPGEASSNGGGKRKREAAADEAGDKEDGDGETATATDEEEPPDEEDKSEREDDETDERDEKPQRRESSDGDGDRVKASPVARRMAEEMGVELGSLEGSGPGGRIVKADVEAAAGDGKKPDTEPQREEEPEREEKEEAAEKPKTPEPVASGDAGPKGELQTQELSRMQRTISRRMAESKATAPDFHLHVDIDMSRCVELRGRLKELSDDAPSYNDMIVKACALALREFPRVNGAYRDGQFELYSRINVGVAVAAQDALIVPTVFDADKRSLGEISRQVRELVAKVRDGKITPPELGGATFTVSNLGMYGIDSFTAVINPPQAAILAVGALKKRPAVEESGRVVAKDLMSATLVCDHRILYGADGAEFLARVRELLEQPLSFAL